MLIYLEKTAAYALTALFCILSVYTFYRVIILIRDTSVGEDSGKSFLHKIWVSFLWLIFITPFAAIVYMIASRDPATDKMIKERAYQQDTQHLKRPPPKQLYKEPGK